MSCQSPTNQSAILETWKQREMFAESQLAARRKTQSGQLKRRRGAAMVLGLCLLFSLLAVLAMILDLSNISIARAELRRTADSTALGGCWELYEQKVLNATSDQTMDEVFRAASLLAEKNKIAAGSAQLCPIHSDLEYGRWESGNPNGFERCDPLQANAVRATIRRDGDINLKIPFYFPQVLGTSGQSLKTTAIAAMSNRIGGFEIDPQFPQPINLLPIALDLETWNKVLAKKTEDRFRVCDGKVVAEPDGLFECSLYPAGTGAAGNRGTVDIGGADNSTADIARQILTGISLEDLIALGRPLILNEYAYLLLSGDTGISAGIKDELATIIGQRRMIPIFESVTGQGNEAYYRIVRFEGVSILDVKLTGTPLQKRIMIQPAISLARGAVEGPPKTTPSQYLYAPVMLVQ